MRLQDLLECSGYIPQTPEEARDPRWSRALSVDVNIHTMEEQYRKMYGPFDTTVNEAVEPAADSAWSKGIESLEKNAGFKFVPLAGMAPTKVIGASKTAAHKIIRYQDRCIVVLAVKGINMPFYLSTGEGGKVSVPAGKWYPFFGLGANDWFNKASEQAINMFYGSNYLKTIAKLLDLRIGDVRNDDSIPFGLKTAKPVINQDMENPQSTIREGSPTFDQEVQTLKKRINAVLAKLGDKPLFKIAESVNEESCKYGRYWCSTDKKYKCRQAPKQTRNT